MCEPGGADVSATRVAVVQLRVRTNRAEDNIARATAYIRAAKERGCRLVVLPEAFATGLDLPRSKSLAAQAPGPVVKQVAALAAEERVHVAGGFLERDGECVYSAAFVVDDRGELLHVHRRTNVYDLEGHFLSSGQASEVVDTAVGRLGFVIGYDVQFPETFRTLFAKRAELILCPALLLRPFASSVALMIRARAAENCCYILFASATGENTIAGLTYMGHSAILQSPIGVRPYSNEFRKQEPALAECSTEEGLLVADLDIVALRRLQRVNPLLRDFERSRFFDALTGECAGNSPPATGGG